TCANLAVLYADGGLFPAAESAGRRALQILERVLGPGDAEVGLTLLNLATTVASPGPRAHAVTPVARPAACIVPGPPDRRPHRPPPERHRRRAAHTPTEPSVTPASLGRLRRPALIPALPRPAWVVLSGDFASAVGIGLTLPFLFV